jgi:transcriptional regulator with XRE-family HTH domain
MRKSRAKNARYRPGTWYRSGNTGTLREQMAEYARGEVLLELRHAKRKSREDVASDLGVTAKTLWAWEKESGGIKPENTNRLAEYYGVEPESLVTRDPADGPVPFIGPGAQLAEVNAKLDQVIRMLAEFQGRISGPELIKDLQADITDLDERLARVSEQFPPDPPGLREAG